jgi:hypothetical protein
MQQASELCRKANIKWARSTNHRNCVLCDNDTAACKSAMQQAIVAHIFAAGITQRKTVLAPHPRPLE